MLRGRTPECAALDRLLLRTQAGQSQILVLRGESGIGKTALLDYLAERASGCRVMRAVGVESEMELPFAGVHQLCGPLLDRLDHLPGPQSGALATAFGLEAGDPPNRTSPSNCGENWTDGPFAPRPSRATISAVIRFRYSPDISFDSSATVRASTRSFGRFCAAGG